jgi:hypothetical protein
VEGVIKDIGIFIAANPAQRVELEGSFQHVRIKRCKLKAADVQ